MTYTLCNSPLRTQRFRRHKCVMTSFRVFIKMCTLAIVDRCLRLEHLNMIRLTVRRVEFVPDLGVDSISTDTFSNYVYERVLTRLGNMYEVPQCVQVSTPGTY